MHEVRPATFKKVSKRSCIDKWLAGPVAQYWVRKRQSTTVAEEDHFAKSANYSEHWSIYLHAWSYWNLGKPRWCQELLWGANNTWVVRSHKCECMPDTSIHLHKVRVHVQELSSWWIRCSIYRLVCWLSWVDIHRHSVLRCCKHRENAY